MPQSSGNQRGYPSNQSEASKRVWLGCGLAKGQTRIVRKPTKIEAMKSTH